MNYNTRLVTSQRIAANIIADYGNDPEAYSDRVEAIVADQGGDSRMVYMVRKALQGILPRRKSNAKTKNKSKRQTFAMTA